MCCLLSGCSMLSPKPSPQTKNNLKETYKEKTTFFPQPQLPHREIVIPSSNVVLPPLEGGITIVERSYTKEDLSQSSPIFAPAPPEPTFWQKIKSFVLKYSIILGIICFLFPSVGMFIVTFIYKRTRNALSQVVEGIDNFKEEGPEGNKELLNNLSKAMDKSAKKLVKRLK
jgi:hypothetical protein